jgi:hypothetical protein
MGKSFVVKFFHQMLRSHAHTPPTVPGEWQNFASDQTSMLWASFPPSRRRRYNDALGGVVPWFVGVWRCCGCGAGGRRKASKDFLLSSTEMFLLLVLSGGARVLLPSDITIAHGTTPRAHSYSHYLCFPSLSSLLELSTSSCSVAAPRFNLFVLLALGSEVACYADVLLRLMV